MHWKLVAFVTIIPLLAIQSAYAQNGKSDPLCEFACWMSPEDAPASCGCKPSKGGILKQPPTTPAQKPSSAPAPIPPQAQPKSTVSNCQVICQTNPMGAPAECNCALSQGGGTGGAGGGMGPAVTPQSIAADGMVSVDELLDYMIQLYRSRIAGVQRMQFMERTVAGQSEPLSRREHEPRVIPVANPQPSQEKPTAQDTPITGVDTMIPVWNYLEKVWRGDHEAFKRLTPPELAALRDLTPPPGSRNHRDLAVAKKVQKDPAMLLEALGLKGMAKDMRDQVEQEKNDEALFAEDVLKELLELKMALEAEATSATKATNATQSQLGLKLKDEDPQEPNPIPRSQVYLGMYNLNTLKFMIGPRCASILGCSMQEIEKAMDTFYPGQVARRYRLSEFFDDHNFCLVWRPAPEALDQFKMNNESAIVSDAKAAELWLPLANELVRNISSKLQTLAGKGDNSPRVVLENSDFDRPIRAKVSFLTATAAGFQATTMDRVYGDFRKVPTSVGPAMYEPHRIREELRSAPCPDSVDEVMVLKMLLYTGSSVKKEITDRVMKGKGTPLETCVTAVLSAKQLMTDRFREEFQINKPIKSAVEEGRRVYEEFGCRGTPDSPCKKLNDGEPK